MPVVCPAAMKRHHSSASDQPAPLATDPAQFAVPGVARESVSSQPPVSTRLYSSGLWYLPAPSMAGPAAAPDSAPGNDSPGNDSPGNAAVGAIEISSAVSSFGPLSPGAFLSSLPTPPPSATDYSGLVEESPDVSLANDGGGGSVDYFYSHDSSFSFSSPGLLPLPSATQANNDGGRVDGYQSTNPYNHQSRFPMLPGSVNNPGEGMTHQTAPNIPNSTSLVVFRGQDSPAASPLDSESQRSQSPPGKRARGSAGSRAPRAQQALQPRMRASCDPCYRAKIKCSKTKPLCIQCVSRGRDCKYSPATRAARSRPSVHAPDMPNGTAQQGNTATGPAPVPQLGSGLAEFFPMPVSAYYDGASTYSTAGIDGYTPPESENGGMSRTHSSMGEDLTTNYYVAALMPQHFSSMSIVNTPRSFLYGGDPPAVLTAVGHPAGHIAPPGHPIPQHQQLQGEFSALPMPDHCGCSATQLGNIRSLDEATLSDQLDPLNYVICTLRTCVEICLIPCRYCQHHPSPSTPVRVLGDVLMAVLSLYKKVALAHLTARNSGDDSFHDEWPRITITTGYGWHTLKTQGVMGWELDQATITNDLSRLNTLFTMFSDRCTTVAGYDEALADMATDVQALFISAIRDIRITAISGRQWQPFADHLPPAGDQVLGTIFPDLG
jgi:hypothetical protein